MKYCSNCGKEIDDKAYVCPNCGVKVVSEERIKDKSNVFAGLSYLGILMPLLGWIFGGIGLSKASKLNGKGSGLAIGGIIVSTVSFIIGFASI